MNASESKAGLWGGWLALALVPLAALLAEAAAWWWMNPASSGAEATVLSYRFPEEREGHLARPIRPGIVRALKCDSGQQGLIALGQGGVLEVSYFEWDGTDRTGLMEAFGHSPEECMGVAGFEVEAFLPSRTYHVDGHDLVFEVTRFQDKQGGPLFIYKAPWAEGFSGINLLRDGPRGESARRFRFVATGQRWKPRFARVVMAGVSGLAEEEAAWHHFQETVLRDLRILEVPIKHD